MKIGYARVSTMDQNLDLQIDALKKAGCEKIFTDVSTGSKSERPGLEEALNFVRKDDILVTWRLDRLGRSLKHLIEMVNLLEGCSVGFESLQESIDTTTPGGTLVFHIFGAMAEFERSLIVERTKSGLTAARARGRNGGRPPALSSTKIKQLRSMSKSSDASVRDICETFNISKSTYYKYVQGITN
jgi:DNA invertase Pin-like site-specific DNA recombinase